MDAPNTEDKPLQETHIWGQKTQLSCARAHSDDPREWLRPHPVAPSLTHYQIEHLGIMHAHSPYQVVRMNQSGAFFLVTTRGSGRILVNGQWHTCTPGEACLLPAYNTNALRCDNQSPWEFCWVRYHHPEGQTPLIHSTQALVAPFPHIPFLTAIQGLLEEAKSPDRLAVTQQWSQLVHIYVSEFITSHQHDDRLWKLWFAVEKNLELDWNLDSMARISCMSAEHLRRLCKSQYGRSPIQQLRWLRMQRAAEMLLTTEFKIESIAYDVGYKNPIVFSAAFKKQFGTQPSQFRSQNIHP
ncbi:AraC family transcriptional regulator [Rubritalea tangerina]|uniref:AraC family transcriptional regulator n=1 Tax=Rubritalea tangerina TaxID=430798 RepID=A0ABW4Z851_9BACT